MIIFSCTINVKGVFFYFLMYITLKDTFLAVFFYDFEAILVWLQASECVFPVFACTFDYF